MKQASTKFLLPLVLGSGLVAQTSNNSATIYNVSTVAGSVPSGQGDGGPANLSLLLEADGVAVDPSGNIFISDSVAGRVRKIAAGTGIVSNYFAPGTSIFGLATDSAGNVYMAVAGWHAVVKCGPKCTAAPTNTGTLASGAYVFVAGNTNHNSGYSGDGGQATPSGRGGILNSPHGVAVDAAGNVYIADTSNNRVRKVNTAGVISTIAGTGAAAAPVVAGSPFTCAAATDIVGDGCLATQAILNGPWGVTVDPATGNVYIADSANNRVRLITASSGIVTTVAGNGTATTSITTTTVFTGGLPSTVLGDGQLATSATLKSPYYVTFDGNGNMFVADNGNTRIRKVSNSVISSYGPSNTNGNGIIATGFVSPRQMAVDQNGNLLVADGFSLKSIDPNFFIQTTVAGRTPFSGDNGGATAGTLLNGAANGIAVDNAGNIYISDAGNNRIREVSNGIINTIVGNGIAASSTTLGDGGNAQTGRLNAPGCVAVDPSGNIYISDTGDNRIRKISGGVINTIVGPALANGQTTPYAVALLRLPTIPSTTPATPQTASCVAVDSTGTNVYFTEGNSVQKLNQITGLISVVAGQPSFTGNITATVNGATTVTGTGTVAGAAGVDGDGGPGVNALLNGPTGLAVDNAGNVFIADTQNQLIRRVDGVTGIITTISGVVGGGSDDAGTPNVTTGAVSTNPAFGQRLNKPQGVAVDSSGNVYIANTGSGYIDKIDTNGNLFRIAGGASNLAETGTALSNTSASPGTQILSPAAIAVDTQGNVYFTDRIGLVRKLTPVSNSGK